MTYEQKQDILKMRLDGFTVQEIADEFGTTRQNVSRLLNGIVSERKRNCKKCKCIFPGLKAWMVKNRVSTLQLFRDVKVFSTYPKLYFRMTGKHEFRVSEVKAILAYTGLTFEEAFGVVEPLDGADQDAK